jgi:hypothetical protein
VTLNGKDLKGRSMRVDFAKPRPPREYWPVTLSWHNEGIVDHLFPWKDNLTSLYMLVGCMNWSLENLCQAALHLYKKKKKEKLDRF